MGGALKQNAAGDWSLTKGDQVSAITHEEAADTCLRTYVPKEFRTLLETNKHEAKSDLEFLGWEAEGLFALLETFLEEQMTAEHRFTKAKANHVMAGILQLTSGFQERLAETLAKFYPNKNAVAPA